MILMSYLTIFRDGFDWMININDFIKKFDWLISKKWNFFQGFKFTFNSANTLIKLNHQKRTMAGAGKSGKGVGKVGAKRHAKKTTK